MSNLIQRHASNHHPDQINHFGNVIDLYLVLVPNTGYKVTLATFNNETSMPIQETHEHNLENAEQRYFQLKSALNLVQRPVEGS